MTATRQDVYLALDSVVNVIYDQQEPTEVESAVVDAVGDMVGLLKTDMGARELLFVLERWYREQIAGVREPGPV